MSANISNGVFTYPNNNVTFTIDDLNFWYLFNIKYTISAGCQFGALFIMFLVTWIMTSSSKRGTPVFILNMLSLGFGALRSLFSMIAELSHFNQFYVWFTNDVTYVTSGDQAISILGIIFQWLMLVFVNMSLVLNAYTVCKTLDKKFRHPIMAVSIFFMVGVAGWRLAQVVLNSEAVIGTNYWILESQNSWFSRVVGLAFETGSIWWFCFIFSGKLILAQRERKKLGMKRWPATQLLSSIAGATMIVPAIFAVLEWTARLQMPFAFTLTLTLVALLLPLSSLWASKITRDGAAEFTSNRLWGGFTGHTGQTGKNGSDRNVSLLGKTSWNTESTRDTDPRDRRPGTMQLSYLSAMTDSSICTMPRRNSTEADLDTIGVRVNKTYFVQSGPDCSA